jgi:hypothetical protein
VVHLCFQYYLPPYQLPWPWLQSLPHLGIHQVAPLILISHFFKHFRDFYSMLMRNLRWQWHIRRDACMRPLNPKNIEIEIENLGNLINKLTHSCKGEFSQKNKLMVCGQAPSIEERGPLIQ